MNHDDPFDDDFMERAGKQQRKFAVFGLASFVFIILFVATIIYFFLAAAGVVPPLDLIPFVPYV